MNVTNGYRLDASDEEWEKFEKILEDLRYIFDCEADGYKRQEIMEKLEALT